MKFHVERPRNSSPKVPRGTFHYTVTIPTLLLYFTPTTAFAQDLLRERVQRDSRQQILIESAGLFWIAAEILILLCVIAARDHLLRNPAQPTWSLTPTLRGWIAYASGGFLALAALTIVPRLVTPNPVRALSNPEITPTAFTDIYLSTVHTHLATWSLFITLWVVLEILIVYQGIQVYRLIRAKLSHA